MEHVMSAYLERIRVGIFLQTHATAELVVGPSRDLKVSNLHRLLIILSYRAGAAHPVFVLFAFTVPAVARWICNMR